MASPKENPDWLKIQARVARERICVHWTPGAGYCGRTDTMLYAGGLYCPDHGPETTVTPRTPEMDAPVDYENSRFTIRTGHSGSQTEWTGKLRDRPRDA